MIYTNDTPFDVLLHVTALEGHPDITVEFARCEVEIFWKHSLRE
jgi:hypothetical protein